ncbi:hypothetical protein [Halomarina rubra]|uniref:Transposase n=1 Tax=Halomarina rubra TaxID=2071873 RepID=A0ABD6AUL0_9EURY|nr:hypothetical protein [Halomarina rubra]
MLLDYVRTDVRSVADDPFRHVLRQPVRDGSSVDTVGWPTGRTTGGRHAVGDFASIDVTVVWMLVGVHARAGQFVDDMLNRAVVEKAVYKCQQWLATVAVSHVYSLVDELVVKHLAHAVRDRYVAFSRLLVIQ